MKFSRFGKTIEIATPAFGSDLSETFAAAYIWDYGLRQSLSDSYASAKNVAEFEAMLDKRWTAIQQGTVGTFSRETDPLEAEINRLARVAVTNAIRAKNIKIASVSKEQWQKLLANYITANRERLEGEAKANLAAAKNAAGDVDLSILTPEEGEAAEAITAEG